MLSTMPAKMQAHDKCPGDVSAPRGVAHRRYPMDNEQNSVPYGYCRCGCGGKTSLARKTRLKNGHVKGQPVPFMPGHHGPRHPKPLDERYTVNPKTGCWDWSGAIAYGYGRCSLNGKSAQAHRVIYELHKGPIPEGLVIDHLCCNKRCVNPDHLEPVTPAENARRRPETRLTMEVVREIRKVTDALCEQYGITPTNLCHIARRSRWCEDE